MRELLINKIQELGLREIAALRSTVFPYLESAHAVAGSSFHVQHPSEVHIFPDLYQRHHGCYHFCDQEDDDGLIQKHADLPILLLSYRRSAISSSMSVRLVVSRVLSLAASPLTTISRTIRWLHTTSI